MTVAPNLPTRNVEQSDDITLGPHEAVEWTGGKDIYLHISRGSQDKELFWIDKYYDDGAPAHLEGNLWELDTHHVVRMVLWNPSAEATVHPHRTWSGGAILTRYLPRGSRLQATSHIEGRTVITLPAGRSMVWDLTNLNDYGWHPDVWFDARGKRMSPRYNVYCYRKGETEPVFPDDASNHPLEHDLGKLRFVSRCDVDVKIEIAYGLKPDRIEADLVLPVLEAAQH
jgi:hypothetical protein